MAGKVLCPKCGGTIVDDGTMAGQAVSCPMCQTHFMMPGDPIPAVQPPPFPQIRIQPAQQRIEQRQQSNCGIASFVLGLFCSMWLVFAFLSDMIQFNKTQTMGTAIAVTFVSMSLFGVIGVGLGIAGMMHPNRRHELAIIGTVLSAIAPVVTLAILTLGFARSTIKINLLHDPPAIKRSA